ncbi:MAG: Eco29kI family restriction endonuclease [Longimicrobiales bacterium]|nr:Eco29kI family restriction endonuclease [Longimicrobiales bacterium]
MTNKPSGEFNPLSLPSLAESVVTALMRQPVHPLPPEETFPGSGIYAIYMLHPLDPYTRLADYNDPSSDRFDWPVYVGKAVPHGSRKGGVEFEAGTGRAIYTRLRQHGNSVAAATNLDEENFRCRFLVTAPVWIRLAESVVIDRYQPVWNAVLDGFGNHDPGGRRATQHRSKWDVLHPGRQWAEKLADPETTQAQVGAEVRAFLDAHDPD